MSKMSGSARNMQALFQFFSRLCQYRYPLLMI
jgi:hypothetical protein